MEQTRSIIADLAYFVSIVFHPLLMPTFLFFVIVIFSPTVLAPWNQEGKYLLLGMICVFTFIFPLLSSFLLFYTRIKDYKQFFSMENPRERVRPFLLVGVIYLLFAYMLHSQLRLNVFIVVILICIAASVIISGIISYFWKISIHAVGISGTLGFLVVLNEGYVSGELFYIIISVIIISGFVLSARLYLNQHSPAQVFAGYLVGLCTSFTGMLYLN